MLSFLNISVQLISQIVSILSMDPFLDKKQSFSSEMNGENVIPKLSDNRRATATFDKRCLHDKLFE